MENQIKELTLEEVKTQASMESQQASASERLQIIIIKLGQQEYALPIDHVKEIVLTPGIAKMPQTPEYVKGVANIRGTIIAIMDLEQKFQLTDHHKDDGYYNYTLVIESDEFKVGILVHNVPATLTIEKDQIDESTSVLQYTSLDEDCIQGVIKSDNRLIILLDIIELIRQIDLSKAKI